VPKKDLQNFGGAFLDILREASWPMRLCVVAGFAAGLALGLYIVARAFMSEVRPRGMHPALAFLLVCVTGGLGLFAGLVAGCILDAIFSALGRLLFPAAEDPDEQEPGE
jgi:hypothetical protein